MGSRQEPDPALLAPGVWVREHNPLLVTMDLVMEMSIPIRDRPIRILDITTTTTTTIAMTFRPIVGIICRVVEPVILSGGIAGNLATCAEKWNLNKVSNL